MTERRTNATVSLERLAHIHAPASAACASLIVMNV
jgi:hypothetical protein